MILLLNPPATSKPGSSRKKAANHQLRRILFVIRSEGKGSTRIRRENPIFNYGFFRPNPLVFGSAPWENDEHAPSLPVAAPQNKPKLLDQRVKASLMRQELHSADALQVRTSLFKRRSILY